MSAQATAVGQPSASAKTTRKRILTGDRPTAKSFHLGNYYGTLANRVRLQDEYDSFFLIADYHMLTTRSAGSSTAMART
jgi:tryptophanyl-tRNA synthetase